MEDGLIVVHGDVGPDPGAGMSGRIVINGRCPAPPPGVLLRPLKPTKNSRKSTASSKTRACMYPRMPFASPQGGITGRTCRFFGVERRPLANRAPNDGFPNFAPTKPLTRLPRLVCPKMSNRLPSPYRMLPLLENGSMMVSSKKADETITTS